MPYCFLASFFGELSSSEEEDEDEKEVNIMDSGDDDLSRGPTTPRGRMTALDRVVSDSQDVGMTDNETGNFFLVSCPFLSASNCFFTFFVCI